jgi:hypothetical protein
VSKISEGTVDGQSIEVVCPSCGTDQFKVKVTHSYDGPYVELCCLTEDCGDGWLTSVHISVSQRMELM